MDVSIDLTARELARIDREVARLQAAGEGTLTANAFVARMTQKLVRSWLAQEDTRVTAINTTVIQDTARDLVTDPNAAAKLAALGLVMDADGVLRKVVP